MKIGTANYGTNQKNGDFTPKKYFKLKDGEQSFRILPPLGDLADSGKWSVFHSIHYGYKNSKGKMRTFGSSLQKNRKTKMIDQPDAAIERIDKLKAELEKAKQSGNKAKIETLSALVGQMGVYSLDNNHYMNVVDTQGNIGVLKLRHRCKVALDAEIKRLRESGVDPLSADDGRFFTIRRSGSGLDTTFSVSVMSEKINLPGVGNVSKEIVHKLDAGIISRLQNEAAALDKLFKYPTSEEVAQIVAESDLETGVSPAVDRILESKSENDSNEEDGAYDADSIADYVAPVAKVAAPATSTVGAKLAQNVSNTTAKATPKASDEDDMEAFLASLGN